MPVLIAALAACAVGLSAFSLARQPVRPVRRRIEGLRPDLSQAGAKRLPSRVGRFSTRWRAGGLFPAWSIERLRRLAERSGSRLSAPRLLGFWLALVAASFVAGAVAVVFLDRSPLTLGAVLLWVGGGSLAPLVWLRGRARRRTRTIDAALPQAVDMIVTSVEAGLGLQAAMLGVAGRLDGPLGEEFSRVMREIGIGRERDAALLAMAQRTGSRDVGMVARAIAQADRSGITVGTVLRTLAQEVRQRRRDSAREQAARIPVKITVCTIVFIFPTLFLLVLGPVVLHAIDVIGTQAMVVR